MVPSDRQNCKHQAVEWILFTLKVHGSLFQTFPTYLRYPMTQQQQKSDYLQTFQNVLSPIVFLISHNIYIVQIIHPTPNADQEQRLKGHYVVLERKFKFIFRMAAVLSNNPKAKDNFFFFLQIAPLSSVCLFSLLSHENKFMWVVYA